MSGVAVPPVPRFWAKVARTDGCWEWQASRFPKGYGQFGLRHGHNVYAHRYSWELHFGPIPAGMSVCHRCDNPPCVRPDHLFLGSASDNGRDMYAKGRANPMLYDGRLSTLGSTGRYGRGVR